MGKKSMGKINHKFTEVDGITFHSKMESEFYKFLKDKHEKGEIKLFQMQVAFLLQEEFIIVDGKVFFSETKEYKKGRREKVKNNASISYIADFKVIDNDGIEHVIDTKGVSTADFEIKKKMFNLKYPQYNGLKVVCKHKKEWVDFYVARKEKNAAKRKRNTAKKVSSKKPSKVKK